MTNRTALIQVLGAVAYGERKAYEGAHRQAAETDDPEEQRALRTIAAEELRHHKGFVARLRDLGADPDRAMRPYRAALDRYHGAVGGSPVEEAVWSYLGEGVADDLLHWLRRVVDPPTAAFIESVIADEEGHEARAADQLRRLLDTTPGARREGARAARRMAARMVGSGQGTPLPFLAFLRLGRVPDLVSVIVGGQLRRLRAVGIDPFRVGVPAWR